MKPRSAEPSLHSKMLCEVALGLAGDPSIPYYGNRDLALFGAARWYEEHAPRG